MYPKKTMTELRREQYRYNSEVVPHINGWRRNPYTFLKARFYMEASAILVYLLLKTKIKPNTVTMLYALAGILGCILLAIPTNTTYIIAILIFFTKGILDWSDGHFARLTGQTSVTGHILDIYGAFLNDIGLQMGLGFYVAAKTGNDAFYYLIPLIPFFFAIKLTAFSKSILFGELSKKTFLKDIVQRCSDADDTHKASANAKTGVLGRYRKYYEYFSLFLDARARSVDLICLLILIEMYTTISITWIIFIVFIIKGAISLMGGYYIVIKKGLVEKSLDSIVSNIKNSFEEDK